MNSEQHNTSKPEHESAAAENEQLEAQVVRRTTAEIEGQAVGSMFDIDTRLRSGSGQELLAEAVPKEDGGDLQQQERDDSGLAKADEVLADDVSPTTNKGTPFVDQPGSASSGDIGPIEQKREVDETIAYATKSQEDSYADQIASLDVQGDAVTGEATYAVTMRPMDKSESPPPRGPEEKEPETRVNPLVSDLCEGEATMDQAPADEAAEDGPEPFDDEEFARIEAKIIAQVKSEKQAQQQNAGKRLSKMCSQIGRCPVCTLVPPCKHRAKMESIQASAEGSAGSKGRTPKVQSPFVQSFPFAGQGQSTSSRPPQAAHTQAPSQEQYQDPVTGMYLENPFEGEANISVGERSIGGAGPHARRASPQPGSVERVRGLDRGLNRPDIAEHHAKMNQLAAQRRNRQNPYSIYAQTAHTAQDIETEKSLIESIQGAKSTRAQNLRALHNKRKFEASLEQDRRFKQQERLATVEQAPFNQTQHNQSFLGADDSIMVENQEFEQNQTSRRSPRDTLGEPSFLTTSRTGRSTQKVRLRDRRGMYQSIEAKRPERSPAKQEEHELRQAEERLRTIEMISKYREDKIKLEFKKLENDLKFQQQRQSLDKTKTVRNKGYMDRHGRKLAHLAQKRKESQEDFEKTLQEQQRTDLQQREEKRKAYFARQREQLKKQKGEGQGEAPAQVQVQVQVKAPPKEPPAERLASYDQMRVHEQLLAGDPLHPPGWKRSLGAKGSPHRGPTNSGNKRKGKYLKPLPGRGQPGTAEPLGDPDAEGTFDESMAMGDDPDRLLTDKYKGRGAYKAHMKVVQRSIDQAQDNINNASLPRKTKKKKRSPQKRQNVVEKHLDPAVRIQVSDSVMSRGKLSGTEPSREQPVDGETPGADAAARGSGDIPRPAPSERLAALNQNSGDISGVNISPRRPEGQSPQPKQ